MKKFGSLLSAALLSVAVLFATGFGSCCKSCKPCYKEAASCKTKKSCNSCTKPHDDDYLEADYDFDDETFEDEEDMK